MTDNAQRRIVSLMFLVCGVRSERYVPPRIPQKPSMPRSIKRLRTPSSQITSFSRRSVRTLVLILMSHLTQHACCILITDQQNLMDLSRRVGDHQYTTKMVSPLIYPLPCSFPTHAFVALLYAQGWVDKPPKGAAVSVPDFSKSHLSPSAVNPGACGGKKNALASGSGT